MQSPFGDIIELCDRLKIFKFNYGLRFLFILFASLFLNISPTFAIETNPPTLNSITVDNSVIDVTSGTQSVTFTFDASDDSGIDWSKTYLQFEPPYSKGARYYYGSNDNPGTFTTFFDSSDEGVWKIDHLRLFDIFNNYQFISGDSEFSNYGFSGLIVNNGFYDGVTESDIELTPPTLNSVTVYNWFIDEVTSIDVSSEAQTVDFVFDASDNSGIDWSNTKLELEAPGSGSNRSFYGSNDNPGTFTTSFDSSDEGVWKIDNLRLYDIFNNLRYVNRDNTFASYGFSGLIVNNGLYDDHVSTQTLDLDQDGSFDALTDALLILRYAFGLRGENLTNGSISLGSSILPEEVEANVEQAESNADIDKNGTLDALTDGLLLLRYAFGLRDENLVNNSIASDATRTTAGFIEAYIESRIP